MTGAVVLRAGEGERHEMGPNSTLIKATSDDTGGSFFFSETTIAPGFQGPPLHVHEKLHDMFYVLEGTLNVRIGDEEFEGGPGTFVCVPPGTPHKFSNQSDKPVRFLNFNTPGGWEDYMRDLASAAAGGQTLTPQEIGAIASRYDFRPAP
jgi:mannose-6-phosphate isomerase-like protein (cupin superfamily)